MEEYMQVWMNGKELKKRQDSTEEYDPITKRVSIGYKHKKFEDLIEYMLGNEDMNGPFEFVEEEKELVEKLKNNLSKVKTDTNHSLMIHTYKNGVELKDKIFGLRDRVNMDESIFDVVDADFGVSGKQHNLEIRLKLDYDGGN